MNGPILDTENDGSIVLNEDKLAGLRLFPSSKGDMVTNGMESVPVKGLNILSIDKG